MQKLVSMGLIYQLEWKISTFMYLTKKFFLQKNVYWCKDAIFVKPPSNFCFANARIYWRFFQESFIADTILETNFIFWQNRAKFMFPKEATSIDGRKFFWLLERETCQFWIILETEDNADSTSRLNGFE